MSSSNKTSNFREIPGFYYDEEKKRYFRITKDHPIKRPCQIKKGQKAKEIKKKRQDEKFIPNFKVLIDKERRPLTTPNLERCFRMGLIRLLDVENQGQCLQLDLARSDLEGKVNTHKLILNTFQNRLFVASKIDGSNRSLFQIYDVMESKRNRLTLDLVIDMAPAHCTSISFTSLSKELANILLISTINDTNGLCRTEEVYIQSSSLYRQSIINKRKGETIWASCLFQSPFTDRDIALATSGGVLLTKRLAIPKNISFQKTTKSDVLALEYSRQVNCLFAGSRDSTVSCLDFRQSRPISVARAKQSIDNLKHLDNEFHILISTMAGHIELWDTRTWKPVLSYEGHYNTHSMLEMQLDANEDFLASVGEDCVTRIWDVRTSNLIKTIPSFRTDADNAPIMPAISFFGRKRSSLSPGGLLYGIKDKVYFNAL